MHARIVSVQVPPDRIEEAGSIFRDAIAPALIEQEGFRSSVLLTDRTSGKGMTITIWESEEALRANEESGAFRENLGRVQSLITGPPTVETYEVKLFEPASVDPARMRIIRVQVQPDRVDDTVDIFRSSIVPAAKELPGYRAVMLAIDPATGKGLSATAWDSDEHLQAGDNSGYVQEQIGKVASYLAAPPQRETYDVSHRVVRG